MAQADSETSENPSEIDLIDTIHEHLGKAIGIVDTVRQAQGATPIEYAMWAAQDSLDEVAEAFGCLNNRMGYKLPACERI